MIIDFIVIIIEKHTSLFGSQINVWYDKLRMTAVLLDVFMVAVGFIISRFIFTHFNIDFSPIKFIIVALFVQQMHYFGLYKLFVENHKGGNIILEICQSYAKSYPKENKAKIFIDDNLFMFIGNVFEKYSNL